MVPSRSNFCHTCGDSLPPDAAYCPACGTAVVGRSSPRSPRRDWSGRASGAVYHRRLEDYLARGWSIEREFDDRVVLVNRGFGSLVPHIALVFFTQGIGNLVYAWYCYGPGAPRRELRVDGTDQSLDDTGGRFAGVDLPTVAGLGVGVVALPLALWLFLTGYTNVLVVALLVTTLLLLGVTLRSWAADPESVTTFGRKRTLTEQSIGDVPEACADCGDVILDGVERTFAERTYLAGVPLRTHETGSNRYCGDCATDDKRVHTVAYDREKERELA
jgi:predicted RNA-binding Zn-ribbon protein involved in translation (DUF1610 family)